MLFTENSFKLGGELVRAIVTGNAESAVSARYLSARSFQPRIQHGYFNELVSTQTLGGVFTCLISFKPCELADDVDIALGLDWLTHLREHLCELGALSPPSNAPSNLPEGSQSNTSDDMASNPADQGEVGVTERAPHIIRQIFCDYNTSMSFFSNDDILTSLLAQHGILREQYRPREQRSMLVHHLL